MDDVAQFDLKSAERISRAVIRVERSPMYPHTPTRRVPYLPGDGGATCNTIRFRVAATIPNSMSVVGLIMAVDAGFGASDIPGTSNILITGFEGTPTAIICDPTCSFFNEPSAGLLDRVGYAKYMQPLPRFPTTCQPDVYYPFTPEWEVFALNCLLNPICGT